MEEKQRCGADLHLLGGGGGELIQKILVRLPVKSLGRFKMVSKSWCSLIENPFFFIDDLFPTNTFILLASHKRYSPKFQGIVSPNYSIIRISSSSLDISSGSSLSSGCVWRSSSCSNPHDQYNNTQLLFEVDISRGGVQQLLLFKLDNFGFPEFGDFSERVRDSGLPDDFKCCEFGKEMIGSCNGIICLYDSTLSEISLWNPTTGELKILPRAMKVVKDHLPMRLVGFGFDDETKDHKVVLITGFGRPRSPGYEPNLLPINYRYRVQIYSLSTDSWRLLEGITSLPGDPFFSDPWEVVCLGSCCFFLAQFFRPCFRKNTMFVISFDFTKEIFTPIQLPDHHPHQKLYLRCLGVYKLVLFAVRPSPGGGCGQRCNPDMYILPTNWSSYPESYEPPQGYCYSQVSGGIEDYNLWLLDKQHVVSNSSSSGIVNKESWIPWHSFQLKHQRFGEWTSPSCISNDGEFLLLETKASNYFDNKMKLYSFAAHEVTKDFLCCSEVRSIAYAYKPSLVKLKVGSSMPTNQA